MFQLLVAVISILLVAILVIAALYYGGSAHTEAAIRADYAANMNAAAQIEGAMQLYFNDKGMNPPGEDDVLLQHLVNTGYLKEIPDGEWKVRPDTLYKPTKLQQIEECYTMNKVAGYNIDEPDLAEYQGCPPCNGEIGSAQLALAEKYKQWPGCQFVNAGIPGDDEDEI